MPLAIPAEVRKLLDEKLRAAGTSLAAVEVYKMSLALDELVKRPEIGPLLLLGPASRSSSPPALSPTILLLSRTAELPVV